MWVTVAACSHGVQDQRMARSLVPRSVQEDAIEVVTPLAGVEDGWDFRKGWGVGNSRKREQQERVQLA